MLSTRKQLVASSSRRQKNRYETRKKLLTAARELTTAGEKFSIADVAKRAGISVATAYRYYSDLEGLKCDASLELSMSSKSGASIEEFAEQVKDIADPLERLLIAQRNILKFVMTHQGEYRMYIAKGHEQIVRAKLDKKAVPAGGLRILVIKIALSGLEGKLSDDQMAELTLSLVQLIGPDAFFALRDYANLDDAGIFEASETAIRTVYTGLMQKFGVPLPG